MTATRRLAAVLAADVVSYSVQMGADDAGTLARVRTLREKTIEPLAASHGGRLFKTMGDGFLLEFASAVQALQCAIAIQTAVNAVPGGLRLRIGVHQGEVVDEGGDLFGDGVIVAARLEPLADHGGVVISSRVREDASGKVPLDVEDLGEPALKNIAAKIRAFKVRMDAPSIPAQPAPPLPDKPSVAVLPFQNMSGDPEQEYFADGMTEDIITELSRFRALFVIARNSTFTYKGKPVDIRQVSRDLGVRYVIEGSVRKAGNRVRVTAQLIDALTGNHLWAERYDRSLEDIFGVQEDVTRSIVAAVAPSVEMAEIALARHARPDETAAYLTWRAQGLLRETAHKGTSAHILETIDAAAQALAADPASLAALEVLAMSHWACHLSRWGPDPAKALDEMWAVIERMLRIDPLDDRTLTMCGIVRVVRGEHERGLADLRQAIAINPNSSTSLMWLAAGEAMAGAGEESRAHARLAIGLNPRDPRMGSAQLALGMVAFCAREYQEAVHWVDLAIRSEPTWPIRRAVKIACCAQAGDLAQAARERAVLDGFAPDFIPSLFRGENPVFKRPADMDHLLEGLRLAGAAP